MEGVKENDVRERVKFVMRNPGAGENEYVEEGKGGMDEKKKISYGEVMGTRKRFKEGNESDCQRVKFLKRDGD